MIVALGMLLGIVLVYANHFQNAYHFDDFHTIVNNPYAHNVTQSLASFVDARTFSSLPQNQMYRPLFTLLAAIDYQLGNGSPLLFHISSFLWFLGQIILMFFLFMALFDRAKAHPWNRWLSLFGAGWYGFHTANAETINYISARSDSISTFFVVLALVLFIYSPKARRFYLYLIPFLLGALMKPTALMFAPLLLVYCLLFETDQSKLKLKTAFQVLPAFLLAGLFYIMQKVLTPSSFFPSDIPYVNYLITQPFVALHYFKDFFLPTKLCADYGWEALSGLADQRFLIGMLFVIALLGSAAFFSRKGQGRPIAFGIYWFFIALIPTSFFSLSEVLNDHRMFFPFVGLMLAVTWFLGLACISFEEKISKQAWLRWLIVTLCFFVLAASAIGTYHRNQVWRTEETLWHDVTMKSPTNGRGLMNYGLTQMQKGDYLNTLKYYNEALKYAPKYPFLYINLGVVNGALGRSLEAEASFQKALRYGPDNYGSYFYYGRWLVQNGRQNEALPLLERSVELSPTFMDARYWLLSLYQNRREWHKMINLAHQTIAINQNDAIAPKYLSQVNFENEQQAARYVVRLNPTPVNYLNLSLIYYNEGLFNESIFAAKQALILKPDYAEAYNNIGAAHNELHHWDEAIAALEKAISLKPGYQLAINNLNWAKERGGR